MSKSRVGVLISGRGSNMRALVEAARAPDYPAEIVCVVSNRPMLRASITPATNGIATHVSSTIRQFATREAFDAALNAVSACHKISTSSPAPVSCAS